MPKTLQDWLQSSSDDDNESGTLLESGSVHTTTAPPATSFTSLGEGSKEGVSKPKTMVTPLRMPPFESSELVTPTSAASGGGFAPLSARLSAREEIREKMKRYLGEAAVTKSIKEAAAVATSSTTSHGKSFSNLSIQDFNAGTPDVGHGSSMMGGGGGGGEKAVSTATATATASRTEDASRSLNSPPLPSYSLPVEPPTAVGGGFRAVEVMVVDRGTQTVETVGVQTDPLPPPPFSAWFSMFSDPRIEMCSPLGRSRASFPLGHFHESSAYWHPEMKRMGGMGGEGGKREDKEGTARVDGSGAVGAPTFLYGNLPGVDYTSSTSAPPLIGIDGRPYRQLMNDVEMQYSEGAKYLRSQLTMLQNNIDMLISRYNLPPPPNF